MSACSSCVIFYGEGGRKVRGLPRPTFGRKRVSRLLAAFALKGAAALPVRVELRQ